MHNCIVRVQCTMLFLAVVDFTTSRTSNISGTYFLKVFAQKNILGEYKTSFLQDTRSLPFFVLFLVGGVRHLYFYFVSLEHMVTVVLTLMILIYIITLKCPGPSSVFLCFFQATFLFLLSTLLSVWWFQFCNPEPSVYLLILSIPLFCFSVYRTWQYYWYLFFSLNFSFFNF